ncbi:3'-5' exonuclease [Pseudoflavonifractor capillosus]|uniref:3'-5' exonuclease n=1 Tax=Pseudoflavonifractor capillosus TaxID=106588 RepID=UPI0019588DB9|nr:3'-5' exonuclease [Pseudoflavonifractor capillosus]MBM6695387.1 3'-5' exonuclease [Pseudoflavonifractor capillosus]
MQIGEKSAAAMSMCARLPYCHLCLLEDILNDYTPESEREQEMAKELLEIATDARRTSHHRGKTDRKNASVNINCAEERHRLVVQGLKAQIARLEQEVDEMGQREAKANKRLDSLIDAYQCLLCEQCKREGPIRGIDLPARIVLDTETTGLDPRRDELLQISVLDADTGATVLNTYVRPIWTLEWPQAQNIHGITPEMVAEAPTLAELHLELRAIFGTAREIIGYNTFFDLAFLEPYGINSYREIVDVMMDFAPIYGEWSEYHDDYKWQSLSTCAAYFGYDWGEDKVHDSLADCKATLFCYHKLRS